MKNPNLLICLVFVCLSAANSLGQDSSGDTDAVMLGSPTYNMPQSVIDAEIDGVVQVGIRVDKSGKPEKVVVISGPSWPCGVTPVKELQELGTTITDAMMKVRFTPAAKDGKPITQDISLKITLKNPKLVPQPAGIDPMTGKPMPKMVQGGVINGKAAFLAKPSYPAEAQSSRASGAVEIQILIDETGKVLRAGAVSGSTLLQIAARDAACNSKFSPTLLSGNPVRVSGIMTYNFKP